MAENNIILSNLAMLDRMEHKKVPLFLNKLQDKQLVPIAQLNIIRKEEFVRQAYRALIYISDFVETKDTIDKLCECFEDLELWSQVEILKQVQNPMATVDISVKKAETLMDNEEKYYKMSSEPRGYVLLINVMDFRTAGWRSRRGSNVDLINLGKLWKGLGYKVIEPSDLKNFTSKKCEEKVTSFANMEEHRDADSAVVFVMTHGLNNPHNDHEIELEFADGRCINTEWIISRFSDDNCPHLSGKPKLFFFQACRGRSKDLGRRREKKGSRLLKRWLSFGCRGRHNDFGRARASNVTSDGAPPLSVTKTIGDIIVVYPCVPGKVSLRDEITGAWMVREICTVFQEYACKEHLEAMLRRVSRNLKSQRDELEGMEVLTYENRSFYKQLYFNP